MKKLILLVVVLFGLSGLLYPLGFQSLNSGTNVRFNGIYFTDANIGYAVGGFGTIVKTTNAGVNWFSLSTNTTEALTKVYFLDALNGYVVGDNGVMLKTTNAGANWTVSYPASNSLHGVYFLNNQTGWVVGIYSTCLKTSNAGVNWISQITPYTGNNLVAISFSNSKGFICDQASETNLLTTTNNGVNWVDSKIRSGSISSNGIGFIGNFGVIVGYELAKPLIFTTTNNGVNWSERAINSRSGILNSLSICPTNPSICFTVGKYDYDSLYSNKGMILYSTNAGQTWLEEIWPTDPMVFYGVAATLNAVYVVGNNGLILKSALPIGITPISSEVPDRYALSQNYPNPFNPTTNINFSLSKSGNVKLSVFDLTGKEVVVLVNNQVLQVGTYKVDFDARNLSSGIYFYRLEINSFVQTRKMMLVK